jgi:hypothetical protein
MSTPAPGDAPLPVTKPGRFNYKTLLSRFVVLALVSGSAGLIWWSYYRMLLPRLKESREMDLSVAKLTSETDALEHRWTKGELEEIDQKFTLAQPRLFADQSELEAWLTQVQDQFTPQGLTIKTTLVTTNTPIGGSRKVRIIPATLTLAFPARPGPEGKSSHYQQLLQVTQLLTSGNKIADLTELTVSSGTNSIDHAVLKFEFWAGVKEDK